MTNVTTGKMRLYDYIDVLTCKDERVLDACEYWLKSVPDTQPYCLLCDYRWLDQAKALKEVHAFFVATMDLDPEVEIEHDVIVSGICRNCMVRHGEDVGLKCYAVFCESFPDTVTTCAPHETRQ